MHTVAPQTGLAAVALTGLLYLSSKDPHWAILVGLALGAGYFLYGVQQYLAARNRPIGQLTLTRKKICIPQFRNGAWEHDDIPLRELVDMHVSQDTLILFRPSGQGGVTAAGVVLRGSYGWSTTDLDTGVPTFDDFTQHLSMRMVAHGKDAMTLCGLEALAIDARDAFGIAVGRRGKKWHAVYAVKNLEGWADAMDRFHADGDWDEHKLFVADPAKGDALRDVLRDPLGTMSAEQERLLADVS